MPSPVKSVSLIAGPVDGGGMSGGITVGGASVWNPFGMSITSGGGGASGFGGGGGSGGGGSSSIWISVTSSGSSSLFSAALAVPQTTRMIRPTWNRSEVRLEVSPPLSFLGLLASRLLNIGGCGGRWYGVAVAPSVSGSPPDTGSSLDIESPACRGLGQTLFVLLVQLLTLNQGRATQNGQAPQRQRRI